MEQRVCFESCGEILTGLLRSSTSLDERSLCM